jgi:hypothetical protein
MVPHAGPMAKQSMKYDDNPFGTFRVLRYKNAMSALRPLSRNRAPFVGVCLTNFRCRNSKLRQSHCMGRTEHGRFQSSQERAGDFRTRHRRFYHGNRWHLAARLLHGRRLPTGTKLTIYGSIDGPHLKEFFLLLSSTGLAYRRCELAWVNGDQIGAKFITQPEMKKQNKAVLDDRSTA